MNVPLVPESIRALVSTVFFPLSLLHEIEIGKCIVLFEILASVTEWSERDGDAEVDADL